MIIKCCNKCPDREIGCHSYCERYKREKAKIDDQRLKHLRKKQAESAIRDVQYNGFKTKYKNDY